MLYQFTGKIGQFYKFNANCKQEEKNGTEHPCSGSLTEKLENPNSKFAENLKSGNPEKQKYLDLYNLQSRTIEHTIPMDGSAAWYVEATGDIFREVAKQSMIYNNGYIKEKIGRLEEFKDINPATIRDIVQFKKATDQELDLFKRKNNLLRNKTNNLPDGHRKTVMLAALDTVDALADWCKNPGKEYTMQEIIKYQKNYPEYSPEYTKVKSSINNLIDIINRDPNKEDN